MSAKHPHLSLPALKPTLLMLLLLAVAGFASYAFREPIYRGISGTAAQFPSMGQVAAVITEPGLVALVVLTGAVALWGWARDRAAFWRLAGAGVGVILAYAASEGIKLLVTEERPCRTLEVVTVLACPEAGSWSWPSNHSVIAGAFATACVMAVPRLLWIVAPAAGLIALSRVAVGAHYLHDVLAGLALGVLVVLVCLVLLRPLIERVAPPAELRETQPVAVAER